MKPLSPVREDKLPETFHLTIVKDPDRQTSWYSVVITKMRGGEVVRRSAIDPSEPNMDLALDALNRVAHRVFYFGEGEDFLGA